MQADIPRTHWSRQGYTQFISNLASAGVHPKVAQQLARHSTISLTMDRYTHIQESEIRIALESLPEIPGAGDDGGDRAETQSGT